MKPRLTIIIVFIVFLILSSCGIRRISNIPYETFDTDVARLLEQAPFNFEVVKSETNTLVFEDKYPGKKHGLLRDVWFEKTTYTIIYKKNNTKDFKGATKPVYTVFTITTKTIESPTDDFAVYETTTPSSRILEKLIIEKLYE